jgi:polyhydroxyalkanoate synthase
MTRASADPITAGQQAWINESVANLQRLVKLPMLWQRAQRVKKGATPSEVVYEADRIKVLHYVSDAPIKHKTPLLFVFALVNRPYILDLLPGKSVVEHFVKAGFDVYLIDWGKPTHADRHKTLETYINGYLYDIIEYLRERTGAPRVSLLGYCMGGAMSAMFAAMHPRKVQNLIMLAAGIDFSTREGLLNVWSDEAVFDVDKFVDTYGNCPAEFLQGAFLMMNPVANLISKPITLMERADNDAFVDEYFTMETWLNDNIPIPGELYRQYVKYLFQQNKLVKGEMPVGRHIVDLKKITCPVLNLMAERDDLVPCVQSEPFNDLVGSSDRKAIKFKAGHIGMAVGSRAQRELWPQAVDWLAQRS